MKSSCAVVLTLVCLLMSTGCVGPMWNACGPCGPGVGCDSGACGESCGGCDSCDGCGELYIDPWINEPADCYDPCDSCGNYNGQSCGKCRAVFTGIKSIWGYKRDGCGTGCDTCAGGRPMFPVADLGGCDGCGGCDSCSTGCDSCSGGCDSCSGGSYGHSSDGVILHEGETIISDSGHGHTSTVATRTAQNRRNSPARQIYRTRSVNGQQPTLAY
ncbi:hypothetical protein [Rhodopirellula baltica]|uniref:Uncharacterized protein n=1 Tax=Rhodopirellula baltica WH47 TaxID=991778 RepID=F2AQU7_RHOBT|nr:hypothetical protein [Rhodopirellula baltica]EGF28001.1 hypothetical protein RBWH47_01456 [Rhodopirellula baltica WH47]